MRKLLGALFAVGVLASSPAQAVTMTVSDSFTLAPVEIGGTLSVDKFDPTLGTLTGVTYKITAFVEAMLGITNFSASPIVGEAFISVAFDVDSGLLPLGASPDFVSVLSTGPVNIAAGAFAGFNLSSTDSFGGAAGPLDAFVGPGTVDLDFSTLTSFGASGFGGDVLFQTSTKAGLEFEIIYDYVTAAVPLPASAPLMALAAGLLGFLSLRRKRFGQAV